jgi:hypothetical protein
VIPLSLWFNGMRVLFIKKSLGVKLFLVASATILVSALTVKKLDDNCALLLLLKFKVKFGIKNTKMIA